MRSTPSTGVETVKIAPGVVINTKMRVLYIERVGYNTLLWLIARGLKNLVVYNRGNTTYLRTTRLLRASFFDEYGLLKVRALPVVLSQVAYVLHKLSSEGLVARENGYYALSRGSTLWNIVKNSTPEEIANFLWELTMEG